MTENRGRHSQSLTALAFRPRGTAEAFTPTLLAMVMVMVVASAGAAPLVPGYEHAADKGRLLASELSCTACHASDEIEPKRGPVLDGVGARLQPEWLRAFLMNPHKVKPGTTMPDVLADRFPANKEGAVEALVHFLASQREWKAPKLFKYSAPHTGGRLFNTIGCAVCHADPIKGEPVAGLVSLDDLEAKYSYPALVDFIQDPLKHRPSGRMPDLALKPQEAADIAAYLIDTLDLAENAARGRHRPLTPNAEIIGTGEKIFRTVGCADCHQLGDMTPRPEWEAPRFDRKGACRVAKYSLSDAQKIELSKPGLPLDEKGQVAQAMATLNCYACHQRDGRGGPSPERMDLFAGDDTLGNEGKFPPHLTGVGAKLKADWLGKVMAGEGAVRPYLRTRMPVFGAHSTRALPSLFASADLPDGNGGGLEGGDRKAGRGLLGTQGGVGCISCHGVGGRRGLAMHSITLEGATERYHPDWFKKHLIDPASTRPGTLMPSFWPGGVAGNQSILGGDTDAQIASIWDYLHTGGELPPGYPDFDQGAFEIEPEGRPAVQRTMMPGAGNQAIAVGFPEGTHFVFDAEHCRLAGVWRGRFIDGYNSWFSRKNPTATPLGGDVKVLGDLPGERGILFRGYRFDAGGVPVFLYRDRVGDVSVRIAPDGEGGLEKTVTRAAGTTRSTISW